MCGCQCSAKQLVGKYPPMCVAAWAYITAAVSMGVTALLFVERSGWEVPRQLLGPLVTHPPTPHESPVGRCTLPRMCLCCSWSAVAGRSPASGWTPWCRPT